MSICNLDAILQLKTVFSNLYSLHEDNYVTKAAVTLFSSLSFKNLPNSTHLSFTRNNLKLKKVTKPQMGVTSSKQIFDITNYNLDNYHCKILRTNQSRFLAKSYNNFTG